MQFLDGDTFGESALTKVLIQCHFKAAHIHANQVPHLIGRPEFLPLPWRKPDPKKFGSSRCLLAKVGICLAVQNLFDDFTAAEKARLIPARSIPDQRFKFLQEYFGFISVHGSDPYQGSGKGRWGTPFKVPHLVQLLPLLGRLHSLGDGVLGVSLGRGRLLELTGDGTTNTFGHDDLSLSNDLLGYGLGSGPP